MKKVLLFVVSAILALTTFAQLPAGSTAPDFTTTDINGNSINLYSYLDSGYTVILDVSAVWCGPCWSYHTGGALEDLWENHGPAGEPGVATTTTDDIVVLWVEGDASTAASLIQGGGNSQGDWTNGGTVHYPIIDDANIASLYEIGYYPTIYTICPSRKVVESGSQNTTYSNAQIECPAAIQGINAALIGYTGENEVCGGAGLDVSVDVQNLGTDPLTNFDINVVENGNVIASQNFSGSLNTYEITNINFGSINTTSSNIEVVITTADANAIDNTIIESINIAQPTSQTVEVYLLTDNYASETYLEIVDESGNVIWTEGNEAIVGNYGTGSETPPADNVGTPLSNNTTYNWNVPITTTGCFTLYVHDYYGDGLGSSQWGGTDGDWELKDNNGIVIAEASVADYGASDMGMFENMAASVGINNIIQNNLTIFPNPVNNLAKVNFTLKEKSIVKSSVINVLGETIMTNVYNLSVGNHQIDLDVTDVTSGVYFIQLEINSQTNTQKITITK